MGSAARFRSAQAGLLAVAVSLKSADWPEVRGILAEDDTLFVPDWGTRFATSSCGEPRRPKGSGGRKGPPAQLLPARRARTQDDSRGVFILPSRVP